MIKPPILKTWEIVEPPKLVDAPRGRLQGSNPFRSFSKCLCTNIPSSPDVTESKHHIALQLSLKLPLPRFNPAPYSEILGTPMPLTHNFASDAYTFQLQGVTR